MKAKSNIKLHSFENENKIDKNHGTFSANLVFEGLLPQANLETVPVFLDVVQLRFELVDVILHREFVVVIIIEISNG